MQVIWANYIFMCVRVFVCLRVCVHEHMYIYFCLAQQIQFQVSTYSLLSVTSYVTNYIPALLYKFYSIFMQLL